MNKSRHKEEKIITPSHLKEQTLARKHKFSFAKKKHVKASPRNEQKTENSHSSPESLEAEQKVFEFFMSLKINDFKFFELPLQVKSLHFFYVFNIFYVVYAIIFSISF